MLPKAVAKTPQGLGLDHNLPFLIGHESNRKPAYTVSPQAYRYYFRYVYDRYHKDEKNLADLQLKGYT